MAIPTSADDIARPLSDEIVRSRVTELLDERWRRSLTLMAAPGGSQAVRSNEEDPVGIEFYVRLRPAHTDAARLGSALLGALGVRYERHTDESSLVERILDQFASMSRAPGRDQFVGRRDAE